MQQTGARLTGDDILRMSQAAAIALEANRGRLDELNVYPVPDGDTGSNMTLTMRGAVRGAEAAEGPSAREVLEGLADGALLAARGNSGVILSQILYGMARAADGVALDGTGLANALAGARQAAWQAVSMPVEGTILTAARWAEEAARHAASAGSDASGVLAAAASAARDAVAETPSLLPVLAEAGVVDAGAEGLAVVLEAMLGEHTAPGTWVEPAALARLEAGVLEEPGNGSGGIPAPPEGDFFGYCTEFFVSGSQVAAEALRADMLGLGDSVVVAQGPRGVRIHVHTFNPQGALDAAASHGAVSRVKAEIMVDAYGHGESRPVTVGLGVVAVAPGPGFAAAFRDMGAHAVVESKGRHPSAEEILAGIRRADSATALVLTNHANAILAARQAGAMAGRPVRVVPTTSAPQGLAALLALRPDEDLDQNAVRMQARAEGVRTVLLTTASRDAVVDGHPVAQGQALGLLEGKVVVVADSLASAADGALKAVTATDMEVVSIFRGDGADEALVGHMTALVEGLWPGVQVEVLDGGQSHYPWIVGLE